MSLVISVIALVKSVCECCENARWNKRTSSRVRTCVKAFEKTCSSECATQGSWEKHQDALSSLRDALSEAETVLKRITGRSSISAMRHAREDLRQLKDLEKRLAQASDLLQVNFHVSAEQQARDLNADLLELIKISGTDNQNMHEQTQLQIQKLTEMLQEPARNRQAQRATEPSFRGHRRRPKRSPPRTSACSPKRRSSWA